MEVQGTTKANEKQDARGADDGVDEQRLMTTNEKRVVNEIGLFLVASAVKFKNKKLSNCQLSSREKPHATNTQQGSLSCVEAWRRAGVERDRRPSSTPTYSSLPPLPLPLLQ